MIKHSDYKGRHTYSTYPHYNYFGLYFFWNIQRDEILFNVTIYFDRKKSATHPISEWKDSLYYADMMRMNQIHFNYLEYKMRLFRKSMILEPKLYMDAVMQDVSDSVFKSAQDEWILIEKSLVNSLTQDNIISEEVRVQKLLEELRAYGPKSNFY